MQVVLRGAARIHKLVERAAQSIEKDGIACTSEFEHTLFDEMNGLCRELMSILLSEGAAIYNHYETEIGERHGGSHGKKVVTLFGETPEIKRPYYYNEDTHKGHYPFDDKLGLVGRYTPAVVDEMIRYAVNHPYEDAAREFSRNHGFKVSADTVREIVGLSRKDAQSFVENKGDNDKNDDEQPNIVCVMADGTGIPLRKKSLHGVKGKNGHAKTREVKAGAIFTASKTAQNEPHRNLDTTTYIATTRRCEKFGKLLRTEFDRRFEKLPETVLYITDGAKWLHTIHQNQFPFAIEILDIFHAIEHLKPLMLGMGFKEGTKKWKQKHNYWKDRIKAGKIKSMLDSIWKKHRDKLGKDAMREYKYFRSNAKRMQYDVYRANGWFIGSGVIESGCKTVIAQRFKCSGMNWSPKGVNALLPLRTLHKSNRLEEFFRYRIRNLKQVKCSA